MKFLHSDFSPPTPQTGFRRLEQERAGGKPVYKLVRKMIKGLWKDATTNEYLKKLGRVWSAGTCKYNRRRTVVTTFTKNSRRYQVVVSAPGRGAMELDSLGEEDPLCRSARLELL